MPINKPSQYDCDNMKSNDTIYINTPSLLYRVIRRLFLDKKLNKLKIFNRQTQKQEVVYQEDCTLVYGFELACIENEKDVPTVISTLNGKVLLRPAVQLKIGLYNSQLISKHFIISIPTAILDTLISKNNRHLAQIKDAQVVEEAIKFRRYKGDYFRKYVQDNNIKSWVPSYCSICGKPVRFKFNAKGIGIDNKCTCGQMNLNQNTMTYDEFSLWMYNQTNPIFKDICKQFWFKERVDND